MAFQGDDRETVGQDWPTIRSGAIPLTRAGPHTDVSQEVILEERDAA